MFTMLLVNISLLITTTKMATVEIDREKKNILFIKVLFCYFHTFAHLCNQVMKEKYVTEVYRHSNRETGCYSEP